MEPITWLIIAAIVLLLGWTEMLGQLIFAAYVLVAGVLLWPAILLHRLSDHRSGRIARLAQHHNTQLSAATLWMAVLAFTIAMLASE